MDYRSSNVTYEIPIQKITSRCRGGVDRNSPNDGFYASGVAEFLPIREKQPLPPRTITRKVVRELGATWPRSEKQQVGLTLLSHFIFWRAGGFGIWDDRGQSSPRQQHKGIAGGSGGLDRQLPGLASCSGNFAACYNTSLPQEPADDCCPHCLGALSGCTCPTVERKRILYRSRQVEGG